MILTNRLIHALVFSCYWCVAESASTFGIKFGHGSTRIGAILGGKSTIEVVLNGEGKRFVPSVLAMRNDLPVFNSDALSLITRKGSLVFDASPAVLNERLIHSQVEASGSTDFKNDEALALYFSYIREIAKTHAGKENAKDCVLSVPTYLDYHQRQNLIRVAELSGLRVLSLVDDISSAALQYASSHGGDVEQDLLFVDSGLHATTLAMVKVIPKAASQGGIATQLKISNAIWDFDISGRRINEIIYAEVLASMQINDPGQVNLILRKKIMAEVERLKRTLSNYPSASFTIEDAFDSRDIKFSLTTSDLKRLTAPLSSAFLEKTQAVLQSANLDLVCIISFAF